MYRYDVSVMDIRPLGEPRVKSFPGDVCDPRFVSSVVAEVAPEVVFHAISAAPTGQNSLNYKLMDDVNVGGTANVLAACAKEGGVRRVIYTSSASVVFTGANMNGLDETAPMPPRTLDHYTV